MFSSKQISEPFYVYKYVNKDRKEVLPAFLLCIPYNRIIKALISLYVQKCILCYTYLIWFLCSQVVISSTDLSVTISHEFVKLSCLNKTKL